MTIALRNAYCSFFIVVTLLTGTVAHASTDKLTFRKDGEAKSNLADLILAFESSPQVRIKIHRQLGMPANACRTKLTRSIDDFDAISSIEKRLEEKGAKLKLAFLVEKLKTAKKPRTISPSELAFLSEVEDCAPLAEELVTLSQLSANWDLAVQTKE